jgi:hypothetical protein
MYGDVFLGRRISDVTCDGLEFSPTGPPDNLMNWDRTPRSFGGMFYYTIVFLQFPKNVGAIIGEDIF